MSTLYIPYNGNSPALVHINGHTVIIIAEDPDELEVGLPLIGGDRLREVFHGDTEEEGNRMLGRIAQELRGGVVVAPGDIKIEELLRSLEDKLPWLQ